MLTAAPPKQGLTEEQVQAFRRDGVICVRQLYTPEQVKRLADALDDIVSKPSPMLGPRTGTSFHADMNSWLTNDEIRDFVLFGPGVHIAQQVFGSKCVNFYYDQIFVKEKLSPLPTPWHHDFTFWPLEGDQIASLWTSVDPVDAASSALEFVAGSHLWPQRFRAIGADGTDFTTGEEGLDTLNVESDRSKYNIISWDLEPGDALLFHALTVHGARGNRSPDKKRRAIATRWCGDDVTYKPGAAVDLVPHGLKAGDRFNADFYPQVLPHIIEAQVARRMAGAILPDPEILAKSSEKVSTYKQVEVRPDF